MYLRYVTMECTTFSLSTFVAETVHGWNENLESMILCMSETTVVMQKENRNGVCSQECNT